MTSKNAVNVYLFLDFRNFISEYVRRRKEVTSGYSYAVLSKQSGVGEDLLRLIVRGSRVLKDEKIPPLAAALNLDESQTRYFTALIKWNQARTEATQKLAWEELQLSRPVRESTALSDLQTALFTKWYAFVILEMINLKGFRPDGTWISKKLKKAVQASACEDAFRTLVELGLVGNLDGRVQPSHASVEGGAGPSSAALLEFHRYMNLMGVNKLETVPRDLREFTAITVSIEKEKLPIIKAEMQKFQKKILGLTAETDKGDVVYQINIQCFPLTDTES